MLYSLDGTTVIAPASGQYWVAPGAVVIGQVTLGEDVSIWFNVVVRGDNDTIAIADGSNVQDGSVLHVDPGYPLSIGPDCTIGHMAMLHGCTIETGSLIGIGATILNGATIGRDCLIGAGALIPEGKMIPPRSVVLGAPGKVVREVTDTDLEMIQRGVEGYKKKWRRFKSELRAGTT